MIVMVVFRKIKSFFLTILAAVRRCFCCFRRRLDDDSSLPVHFETKESKTGSEVNSFETWDSWEGPTSIVSHGGGQNKPPKESYMQSQIHKFREEQQRKKEEEPAIEEDPNLLEELAPKIPKKPQVLIYQRPPEDLVTQKEDLSLQDPMLQGASLLDWEEEGVWEDDADIDVDAVIQMQKEQYRKERKAEQMRKKAERDAQKAKSDSKLATKIS